MIVELIVSALVGLFNAVASIFPSVTVPGWWSSVEGMLADLGGWAAGLGKWVPLGSMVQAVVWVFVALGVALTIRVVRILVSLFTGGGGGAA